MPKPIAVCIEDLDAPAAAARYVRCVALAGGQPGLALDGAGRLLWQRDLVSCGLWVSADQRLILYRQEGMAPVVVRRAGRSLDVPAERPVVLIDQDEVDVGTRRMRIHVHGEAPAVAPPSPLPARPRRLAHLARTAASAAVIGAVVSTAGCIDTEGEPGREGTPTIEVRMEPPKVVTMIVESTRVVESTPTKTAQPTPTIEVQPGGPTPAPATPEAKPAR